MKKVMVVVLVVIMALSFAACGGGGTSAFVGKWAVEDGSGSAPSGLPDNMELFKDGTAVIEERSFFWKIEHDRFVVTSATRGFSYDYEMSGKTLTLMNDDGSSETYVKE